MIVEFFHNLILSLVPYGTNHLLLHAVVMGAISLIICACLRSQVKAFWLSLGLSVFIEIDQLIFKTGACDIEDIFADLAGIMAVLIVLDVINHIFKLPYNDSIIEEMNR